MNGYIIPEKNWNCWLSWIDKNPITVQKRYQSSWYRVLTRLQTDAKLMQYSWVLVKSVNTLEGLVLKWKSDIDTYSFRKTLKDPPDYQIIVITTLLGLILATNSLFNTSPSSLDLVLEIAYWSKILVHLEWLLWPMIDLSLIWYPTRLAWPSPSGGDQDTSAW